MLKRYVFPVHLLDRSHGHGRQVWCHSYVKVTSYVRSKSQHIRELLGVFLLIFKNADFNGGQDTELRYLCYEQFEKKNSFRLPLSSLRTRFDAIRWSLRRMFLYHPHTNDICYNHTVWTFLYKQNGMVKYNVFTIQGQFKDIWNTIYTKLNIENE